MKDSENKDIYIKLRELRRARGITVDTLAKKIGENSQKVGRIERGSRSLTIDYLLKVSKALDTPMESLLESKPAVIEKTSVPTDLLNDVIVFVEGYSSRCKTPLLPLQKAKLISKIYETASKFPKEYQQQYIQSLDESIQLL